MWPWQVKMPTQNLLRLLLLLMLMLRIMLATTCWFGSWRLIIKQNFCSDFEHKVWSRLWSWSSGKIWMVKRLPILAKSWLSCRHWLPLSLTDSLTPSLISLQFVCEEMLMFGWDFEVSWSILGRRTLIKICVWIWYDPLGYFGKMNLTLGSVVPLAMFHSYTRAKGYQRRPVSKADKVACRLHFLTHSLIQI